MFLLPTFWTSVAKFRDFGLTIIFTTVIFTDMCSQLNKWLYAFLRELKKDPHAAEVIKQDQARGDKAGLPTMV